MGLRSLYAVQIKGKTIMKLEEPAIFATEREFIVANDIRLWSVYHKCNRGKSTPDDNETPPEIFNQLDREFNFTIDAAATSENAKCSKFFTKEDCAIKQKSWGKDEVVFLSPPSNKQDKTKFIIKAYNESQKGTIVVLLLANATDSQYFKKWLSKGEVRFIRGRIKFHRFGLQLNNHVPYGSMICIFKKNMRPRKRIVEVDALSRPVDIEPVLWNTVTEYPHLYRDTKQVMEMRGKEFPITEEKLIEHLISESTELIGKYRVYALDRSPEIFALLEG
jgi:phage N-6-adenine-methyltransferase